MSANNYRKLLALFEEFFGLKFLEFILSLLTYESFASTHIASIKNMITRRLVCSEIGATVVDARCLQ